jgi:hypothetical protein
VVLDPSGNEVDRIVGHREARILLAELRDYR